jgi:hypothetical protein
MTNVSLSLFLPLVMPYCPTAPEPIVMQNLRLAARDFCKHTRCWREVVTTQITANPVIPQSSCGGATIVAVQSTLLNGNPLTAVPFDEADIAKYLTEAGRATSITQDSADRFIILPFEAGTLVMSLYFAPSSGPVNTHGNGGIEPQNQVPMFLFREHAEAIAHGALYRILSLPNQEYTDGNMSGYFKTLCDAAKAEASTEVIKGKQRAPIRTKPRFM